MAERIWSHTAQGLLWEQTAAELAVGWHSQADTAGSQRCTKSQGTSLETHGSVSYQSQGLLPSEPSAVLTQGSGTAYTSLAGEAPGSWHALGSLQLLPAGPDTWQLHTHCSRDLLATTPCHGTAVTLPGQSPECPEDREASTAAHAYTTHQLQQLSTVLPPGSPSQSCPCSGPLSRSIHRVKKPLTNNSNHKNKHGEQGGNICSETCCLQEGGQNPSLKHAGYIHGPLSWGVTTNHGLPKQRTAIRSSCTGRRVCL